jgi:recombination protein RecT
MVRPTQFLHPRREPSALLQAATVLLWRDGPQGPEVLMTRRSMQASFAPGAFVFPGGGIDDTDVDAHRLSERRSTQSDLRLTQALAAIRESYEELGIVIADDANGQPVTDAHLAQLDRNQAFYPQVQALGWRLRADRVWVLAHWITDRDMPKRFDVPFLAARMPEGQVPVADEREQFEPIWIRPEDAVQRHAQGQFFMIFPTLRTLERLRGFANVDALFEAFVSEQPLFVSCPRAGKRSGREARFMESDSPFGEVALTCPDGQIVHDLTWQTEQAVPLLRHVQRLTAPNASLMTGPGTNTYVIGDDACGYIVIDPGPADAAHVQRLWALTGQRLRHIVCTHSHPDHSPGAALLQALAQQAGLTVPTWGLPSGPMARPDSVWQPDRLLPDGEQLQVGTDGHTHTLQALHTPGHTANHLCLLLVEDALIFSGDHVLNGSTTVVPPGDGNMTDYLESLDRLHDLIQHHRVGFLLPAHGHVLGNWAGEPFDAAQRVQALKQHRLAREAKIAHAMQQHPEGDLDDWLPLAYDDVPAAVWPVAKLSLQAHVERLQALKASAP